jgi:peroxiredoxin
LVQLQKNKKAFDSLNIRIISILQDREESIKMKNAVKAEFEIAADENGELMDCLGIRHRGGNPIKGSDVSQIASFLFDRNGKVIWSKVADNYRVRPYPNEILAAAKTYFSTENGEK